MIEQDQRVADEAVVEVYEDYFGFGELKTWYFPDQRQHISFQVMNEGQRRDFQAKTNKELRFNRASGDAMLKADPAEERHALIINSVVNWTLKRRGPDGQFQDVPFSKGSKGATLEQWLSVANPKLVDDLEFAIRKANPWLQADMTAEEIRTEMTRLEELLAQAEERERGEGSSSSK